MFHRSLSDAPTNTRTTRTGSGLTTRWSRPGQPSQIQICDTRLRLAGRLISRPLGRFLLSWRPAAGKKSVLEECSMKGEAKGVYKTLVQDLIRLNGNWDIFTKLFTVSEDRYSLFNETAPGFFTLLQYVLLDDAVISLSRLTDPAHLQSLPRLVKLLEGQVDHKFYEEVNSDLASLMLACKDIREHRDKRVAHKARKGEPPRIDAPPSRLPALTRQKIEDAMASCASLLNKALGYFESKEQFFVPVVRGDADSLYFYLEKGHHAAQEEKRARLEHYKGAKSA